MTERRAACRTCSTDTGKNFCSKCRRRIHCSECKAFIEADFDFCEQCGKALIQEGIPEKDMSASTDDINKDNLRTSLRRKLQKVKRGPSRKKSHTPISATEEGTPEEDVSESTNDINKDNLRTSLRRKLQKAKRGQSRKKGHTPISVSEDRSIHIGGACGNVVTGDGNTVNMVTTFSQIRIKSQDDICQELEEWTKGMVETSALMKVMEMLNNGITWITIKGSPGEGKTTVGKMALKELQKSGRQVFQVRSPEEFTEVTKTCSRPVIMLDDILGGIEFDQTAWLRWKDLFHEVLDVKEHKSHEQKTGTSITNCPTVILAGRDYVLNAVSASMGRLHDVIFKPSNVVDMSHSMVREIDEKEKIWDAIVGPSGIKVSRDEINDIFNLQGGHGFPHVCRLFVTLNMENKNLSAYKFFQTPLIFLNESLKIFLKNENKLNLFKQMIIRQLNERDLQMMGCEVRQTAEELLGTYLRIEDGNYVFDHKAIYDSVAFNLCNEHTLFVIENCHLTFIHERLRLKPSLDTERGSDRGETDLVVHISHCFVKDLAKRFADELSKGNLLLVLSHQACTQEMFIKEMMSQLSVSLTKLVNMKDRGSHRRVLKYDRELERHFLTLLASNKSSHLLKYVHEHTVNVCKRNQHRLLLPLARCCKHKNLTKIDTYLVFYGVCKYAATDILTYLIKSRHAIDINVRYEDDKTPLMIAAETGDSEFVHQIMSLNPDLYVHDIRQKTVLHYLSKNGIVSAVKQIIDLGTDVNVKNRGGGSPLTYACRSNHLVMVELLLESGARADDAAVYWACRNGNIAILSKLLEKGGSLDGHLDPLNTALLGDHVDMICYLIEKGYSVNRSDGYGTPLYKACSFKKFQSVQCLLERGAVIDGSVLYDKKHVDMLLKAGADVNVQDEDGQIPLHKAVYYRGDGDLSLPDISVCETLITQGSDVNKQDREGNTPLHLLCCVDSDTKILRDSFHQTASASTAEYRRLVTLFVYNGAEITMLNNRGEPALRGWCQTLLHLVS